MTATATRSTDLLARTTERLGTVEQQNLGARATRAKRSLAEFAQQAIAEGIVDGIKTVEWGPHLDALCFATQMQLEAWLVAYGLGTADMIDRQRRAWEREHPVPVKEGEAPRFERPTWEDGQPEPWLRYVLVQNMLSNFPPGTLKSTIVMVLANAWIWLWCSWFAFAALSGMDANVIRDSKATRDLVRSPWYRENFSISWRDVDLEDESTLLVKRDSDAVSDWATSAGGKRRSRTINAGLTGSHNDGIFPDDPDDADKVWSEAERVRPQNRWTRAGENRVNCDHRSIRHVMQQVVHALGFSAYLLSIKRWSPRNTKGWARLCVPAEFGYGPADAPTETPYGWRDWRTVKGEVIHRRLSPGVLADYRLSMPGYEGQYNQNPARLGSGWMARELARFFILEGDRIPTRPRPEGCPSRASAPPVFVKLADLQRLTLSVDAMNSLDPDPTSKKLSAVGLLVAGRRPSSEEWCGLDDRTRVLGPSETYWAIYELMHAWALERVLVELKALGAGAIDQIRTSIRRGWYLGRDNVTRVPLLGPDGNLTRAVVEVYKPGKDSKEQRAHGDLLPAWNQGRILLRDGADWLYPVLDDNRKTLDEGHIDEVCSYPASRRNDRVDCWTQLIADTRKRVVTTDHHGGFAST